MVTSLHRGPVGSLGGEVRSPGTLRNSWRALETDHLSIGFDCGVGGRLWLNKVQRQVKEQAAWLTDSAKSARVVAG